jgi:hypothetical protein
MQSFLDVRGPSPRTEVRVRTFRTLKTLRTRTQRVCLFVSSSVTFEKNRLLPQNVEMLVLVSENFFRTSEFGRLSPTKWPGPKSFDIGQLTYVVK